MPLPSSLTVSEPRARRAPAVATGLLALATALVVALTGPLALFNPPFVLALQERHGVQAAFEAPRAAVDAVTVSYLRDIYTGGDFEAALADGDAPLIDATERSHMRDVSRLVRLLLLVDVAALGIALVSAWLLRREARRIGAALLAGSAIVGGLAVVLALAFAVAFEPMFLAFHAVLFPPGTYLFAPGSRLIALFPEPFWYEAALAAGAAILVTAAVVSLAGWRLATARR